jgi:long-chain fatty acid transport protein
MKKRILFVTSAALGLLGAHRAMAAGTALDVQSSRGTGMASALTAATDGSDSIYYNPAGIARGKLLDVQLGGTLISPSFKYTSPQGNETKLPFYVVPPLHLYASGGITDSLSVGIGLFTPFGLKVKWPEGWEGRRSSIESQLQTFYVNPTVAYRIGPLRIGGGVQLVRGTVELRRAISFGTSEGQIDVGAGAWGVGGNVGVQLDVLPQLLTVGVAYRSAVKLDFNDGDAHFSNVPTAFQSTLRDQSVSTSLTQPDSLAIGISSHPIKPLLLAADVVWYGWSKLRSVDIVFDDPTLNISAAKNWGDRVNVHGGMEARVHDNWRVRAGALYDPSPARSNTLTPEIPDANRLNLAAGGSYVHRSGIHVDLGYQFIILFSKTSSAPPLFGEYGGSVNVLGLTVGYRSPTREETSTTAPFASEGGGSSSGNGVPLVEPPEPPPPPATTPVVPQEPVVPPTPEPTPPDRP